MAIQKCGLVSSDIYSQGPFDILVTSQLIPVPDCFPERESFHRCFLSRLARHSSRHLANTVVRRENVCNFDSEKGKTLLIIPAHFTKLSVLSDILCSH